MRRRPKNWENPFKGLPAKPSNAGEGIFEAIYEAGADAMLKVNNKRRERIMSKEEPKVIKFEKCPVCKSKKRYCESLATKEKAKGHMREELNFHFQVIEGHCKDPGMEASLPMGTILPAYQVAIDICSDCGTLYVTHIIEGQVIKQPNIILPGQGGGPKLPPFPGTSNVRGN